MTTDNKPSALCLSLGDVAPKLVDLTERVLFADVWERPEPIDERLHHESAMHRRSWVRGALCRSASSSVVPSPSAGRSRTLGAEYVDARESAFDELAACVDVTCGGGYFDE